jgi:plastocyanin
MFYSKLTVFIFFIFIFSHARAETIRMVQADKTFLGDITDKDAVDAFENPAIEEKNKIEAIKAKVGDTILFANRDEVTHNVSGTIDTETIFDVKKQDPGIKNDRSIELTKKGEYIIQCAIHPKMKFKITVD